VRIKAVANGNVIEAHEDAAKILIDAGIYTAADDEPVTASLTPPVPALSVPSQNSTQPTVEKKPAKKRKAR
jgi:hypothetical protein